MQKVHFINVRFQNVIWWNIRSKAFSRSLWRLNFSQKRRPERSNFKESSCNNPSMYVPLVALKAFFKSHYRARLNDDSSTAWVCAKFSILVPGDLITTNSQSLLFRNIVQTHVSRVIWNNISAGLCSTPALASIALAVRQNWNWIWIFCYRFHQECGKCMLHARLPDFVWLAAEVPAREESSREIDLLLAQDDTRQRSKSKRREPCKTGRRNVAIQRSEAEKSSSESRGASCVCTARSYFGEMFWRSPKPNIE